MNFFIKKTYQSVRAVIDGKHILGGIEMRANKSNHFGFAQREYIILILQEHDSYKIHKTNSNWHI
ncbi:hypothetical protein NEIELOOT_01811, partial [Neisseria elongata subsp. glycolytica ATCC 29315]